METIKIASVQCDVAFGEPARNVAFLIDQLTSLAAQGVQMSLFPECFLTGYAAGSAEQAREISIHRDDPLFASIQKVVDDLGIACITGFAEKSENTLFNSAAIFRPNKELLIYRKTHLPHIGLDRYVSQGDEFILVEHSGFRFSVLICFDMRFPEGIRTVSLRGADVIFLPTNWPTGAETSADIICIARAAENHVWMITCDRVGTENGFDFIGRSKIIAPSGKVIASAGRDAEILIAEIDPTEARQKRVINIPGEYELEIFGARRPDLYDVGASNS